MKKLSMDVRIVAQVFEMTCCLNDIGLADVCKFQGISKAVATRIMQNVVMMGYATRTARVYRSNAKVYTYHLTDKGKELVRNDWSKSAWYQVINTRRQNELENIMTFPRTSYAKRWSK